MGEVSERQIKEEQQRQAAIEIAVRAGVLDRCGRCEEVTDTQAVDIEEAYKLANVLFTRKDALARNFKSRREITDLLQNIQKEFSDECWCDRQLSEDN